MTNTTPLAQQALQEELETVRDNIYTDQYDMGIGELLSMYKDCELVIHPDENGYVELNSEKKDMHHRKSADRVTSTIYHSYHGQTRALGTHRR